jgi:hypothetical protein
MKKSASRLQNYYENTLATMVALYPQAFAAAAAADSLSGRALRIWQSEGLNSTVRLSIPLRPHFQSALFEICNKHSLDRRTAVV